MKNFPIRKKLRYENFDYSDEGYYFITICTKNRIPFLWKIENENVILSQYGKIAEKILQDLPKYYKNLILDEYIFMPNHFHGIFILQNNVVGNDFKSFQNNQETDKNRNGLNPFPTEKFHSLSQIISSFKWFTTREIHKNFPNSQFAWQKSFYDTILRDETQLVNIREYIARNPADWQKDEYFL